MVTNIRYSTPENNTIIVEPQGWNCPYPCETYHNSHIQEWLSAGNEIEPYDPFYGLTLEQIQAREIALAENIVKSYVQIPIDNYNQTHGVNFESVYNCTAYKDVDTYPHQTMCIQAIEWNAQVWEAARQLQINIAMGNVAKPTTEEEFISHLPAIPTFG